MVVAVAPTAVAGGPASVAGVYRCVYGCRPTDVDPSIELDGDVANCMNELGGLYRGRAPTATSVLCFGKLGALSADGTILRWSNGVVWARLAPPSR